MKIGDEAPEILKHISYIYDSSIELSQKYSFDNIPNVWGSQY